MVIEKEIKTWHVIDVDGKNTKYYAKWNGHSGHAIIPKEMHIKELNIELYCKERLVTQFLLEIEYKGI